MFDGTLMHHDRPSQDDPERSRHPSRVWNAVRLGLALAMLLGLAAVTAAVPALTPHYIVPGPGAASDDLTTATFIPW